MHKLLDPWRLSSLVVLILLAVMYGSPLAVLVFSSFQEPGSTPALSYERLETMTFANYLTFFERRGAQSLGNSFLIGFGSTAIVIGLGVPAAYWISRVRSRAAPIILLLLVFLQMVPAASSVIPLYPVLASWGILGSLPAVILTTGAMLLPWALILMGPFFSAVPRELLEAASVDGASSIRQFASVVVPLARNGVITVGILTFMISWGEFVYAINFLSRAEQYPASGVLTTYLSALFTDWPGLMAASVITALPIMFVFLVFQRRLSEGLSAGALKG